MTPKGLGLLKLGLVTLTAIGYWFMGSIAGYFAIPPGFSSPFWPAAGFAFLMIATFGRITLVGVFLGSFAINVQIAGASIFELSGKLVVPMLIAFGASLQTFTALLLVRRFTEFKNTQYRANDALTLGVVVGPISCIVSSFVGVTSLYANGVIDRASYIENWFFWWVGDTIGVLVFIPITLLIFWSGRWRNKFKIVLFSSFYLVLVASIVGLFASVRSADEEKVQQLFQARVSGISEIIGKLVFDLEQISKTLSSLFIAFDDVSFVQFSRYALGVYESTPGVYALSWIPKVESSQRVIYEKNMSDLMGEKFNFWERDNNQERMPAKQKEYYYPVYYLEPYVINKEAHGFDIGSDKSRMEAISKAIHTQQIVATETIVLVQEADSQKAFLLLSPIVDSQGNVDSLISSVYRVQELINTMIPQALAKNVAIRIVDTTNDKNFEIIYTNEKEPVGVPVTLPVEVFHRQWTFYFTPTGDYIRENQSSNVWVVLVSGFVIAALCGLFILMMISRSAQIELEVEEKTADLNKALSEAKKANAVKSEFLASMSHELRTPLNSIIGFSVRLLKSKALRNDKSAIESISIIDRNGRHLLSLINDILDLSKVESGKLKIDKQDISLSTAFVELENVLMPMAKDKDVALVINSMPIDSLNVDRKRFMQILINVAANAVKFTEVGSVRIYGDLNNRHGQTGLAIHVADTGIGINKEDISKLFQRYEQLGNNFYSHAGGTGLGLALAQELIFLHNGEISVVSELGKGSIFTCWFPVNS